MLRLRMEYLSGYWLFKIVKFGHQSITSRVGTSFHRYLRITDISLSLLMVGTYKPAHCTWKTYLALFSYLASACGIIAVLFLIGSRGLGHCGLV